MSTVCIWGILEDFVVVLHSLRSDAIRIKVVQPTNAAILHRLTWDPGIWLMDGLQFDTFLRNVARLFSDWATKLPTDSYGILVLIA